MDKENSNCARSNNEGKRGKYETKRRTSNEKAARRKMDYKNREK